MKKDNIKKKEDMVIGVIDKLFRPEILYEDEFVQDRIVDEPMVIICNHSVRRNHLELTADGPIIRYVFENHNVCSLVAKEIMDNAIFKRLTKGLECIPVSRDAAATDWLHKCKAKLKEGKSVIIFPEGTTYKNSEIEEFKPGFALLAKSANVRVLPVAINGVYEPFNYGAMKIKIGTPRRLRIDKMTPSALKTETKRFENIVNSLYLDLIDENINKQENELTFINTDEVVNA